MTHVEDLARTGDATSPAVSLDVAHPKHYSDLKPEPIDAIASWDLGFNLGNVVKYTARADRKGEALSDLKKAAYYLDHELRLRDSSMPRKQTPRELAAAAALLNAATEVASLTMSAKISTLVNALISNKLANALADLWEANDEWQRAQLVACGEDEE